MCPSSCAMVRVAFSLPPMLSTTETELGLHTVRPCLCVWSVTNQPATTRKNKNTPMPPALGPIEAQIRHELPAACTSCTPRPASHSPHPHALLYRRLLTPRTPISSTPLLAQHVFCFDSPLSTTYTTLSIVVEQLQAIQLPARVAHLDARLADVQRNHLAHAVWLWLIGLIKESTEEEWSTHQVR